MNSFTPGIANFHTFSFVCFFPLGEDYFYLQPSWFDTLRNNVGCLEIHYPITARDRKAHKSESSSLKRSNLEVPEAAKGVKSELIERLVLSTSCLNKRQSSYSSDSGGF